MFVSGLLFVVVELHTQQCCCLMGKSSLFRKKQIPVGPLADPSVWSIFRLHIFGFVEGEKVSLLARFVEDDI